MTGGEIVGERDIHCTVYTILYTVLYTLYCIHCIYYTVYTIHGDSEIGEKEGKIAGHGQSGILLEDAMWTLVGGF